MAAQAWRATANLTGGSDDDPPRETRHSHRLRRCQPPTGLSSLNVAAVGDIESSVADRQQIMKRPQSRRAAALLALPASLTGAVTEADEPHGFIRNSRKRRLRGQSSQAVTDDLPLQPRSVDLHRPQQQQRKLNPVSDSYLAAHPYYPNHDLLSCLRDGNFPSWMAWEGGYAEAHLFATGEACCERWFPEVMGCFDGVAEGRIDAAAEMIGEGMDLGGADGAPSVDAIVANVLAGEEDEGWALKRPSSTNNEEATAAGNGADNLVEMASNIRPTGNERPAETGALEGMTYFPTTTEDLAANRPVNERPVANDARPTGLPGPSGGAHDAANSFNHQDSTGYSTRPIVEEPIERGDKTEIVGMAVPPPPAPEPAFIAKAAPAGSSNASPYTIDTSTFGPNSVAAESCTGGCPSGSSCVGNASGGQLIQDTECAACNTGQTWWPCDVQGLCWCWLDGTARIAPAPPSGLEVETTSQYYTVCDDILTRELFHAIAPEAKEPYTYEGLCDAILSYNARHTEKAFGMGDDYQRAAELAAFLGNTLHESDEFKAAREYLMCGDNIVVDSETYCKPCDPGSFDWATKTCRHSLVSGTSDFNEYCQPSSVPPEACLCGNGSGEGGTLEGYVAAKHLFFGRGSIQTSWNYNYIGASIALTGSPDTFCDNPDLIATTPEYIWGAGLYFWMEHVKEGTTSHTEVLGGDFGGSLNNINGGLECPAHGGWHVDAVKMRLNRYCRAAKILNLPNLMRLTNCAGLTESMDTCLSDGMCDECLHFVGSVPGDHPKWVAPASAPTPSGYTQVDEPANDAPLCPDGLMPWDGNSDCCVPNPNVIGDGACDPSAPYNTPVCGFDGGDCCKGTCDQSSAFGCTTKEGDSLGEYGPFGFYCTDPSQGSDVINHILCDVEEKYRLGDGMCNPTLNTPECNYDGGDCCRETCDDYFSFYPCGSGVQGYVCLDPRFAAASDPTHRPTRRPTGSQVDSLGASEECNDTQKECPDGTFVGRNPGNKCKFFPCPTKPQQGKHTFASSISAALQHGKDSFKDDDKPPAHEAWEQAKPASGGLSTCSDDMRECSDGSFVGRNPRDRCRFFKCPVVESESNSLAAGISASFAQNKPSPNKQCKEDARECSDGSFVERNPANQCRFYKCPVAEGGSKKPNSLAAGISASFAQNKPKPMSNEKCGDDMRECSNGSFVERNPANQCRFHDCPPPSSKSAFDSLSASLSSLGQDSECTDEVKPCPGGSFVAQDPDNGCAFFPCPDMMPVSMAGSMHAKDSSQKCTTELKRCPNGKFVAQDPDDDCNYFPCGEMTQMDAAAWASAGGEAPHKKKTDESDASDWARGHEQDAYVGSGAQSQHRKKNRSG
ncbi:hypothetical protein ACHAXT_005309 [Thalassiosira profunda]